MGEHGSGSIFCPTVWLKSNRVHVYFIEYFCFIVFLVASKDINCIFWLILLMFSHCRIEINHFLQTPLIGCGCTYCFAWGVVRPKTAVSTCGFSTGGSENDIYLEILSVNMLFFYFYIFCLASLLHDTKFKQSPMSSLITIICRMKPF